MSKLMGFAGRDKDNVARPIKTDVLGNIGVNVTGDYPLGGSDRAYIETRITTNPTDTSTMITIPPKSIIDEIVIFTDNTNLQVRWQSRNKAGILFDERVAFAANASTLSPQISQMRFTHPFLENIVWDEEAKQFIFKLAKEELHIPFGALIYIAPVATTTQANIYIGIHYRKMEV